jgi:hypothetical protein
MAIVHGCAFPRTIANEVAISNKFDFFRFFLRRVWLVCEKSVVFASVIVSSNNLPP